jgi:hypothetical protein
MDKITKTFEEKLQDVFKEEGTEDSVCDVCSGRRSKTDKVRPTNTFSRASRKEIHKRRIRKMPLNKRHQGTYRHNFEFIVNDSLWAKTMKGDNKYICLECWERDYLTPYLEKVKDREPNEFGFYHVEVRDLETENAVNNDIDLFFTAIDEMEAEKKQAEKDKASNPMGRDGRPMIGSHEFDD